MLLIKEGLIRLTQKKAKEIRNNKEREREREREYVRGDTIRRSIDERKQKYRTLKREEGR